MAKAQPNEDDRQATGFANLTKIRFGEAAVLLTSVALTLAAGGAFAAPEMGAYTGKIGSVFPNTNGAKVLYNQNSNAAGTAIDSQNFTSGINSSYSDAAADDFVVPKGQTWTVTQVDVTGVYFVGSGPAASENVTFYNGKKVPRKTVKGGAFDELSCADKSGSFSCSLGKGIKLKAGHYWVSVVANCSGKSCGEWGWEMNSQVHNHPSVWENPGSGLGVCFVWESIANCGLGYNVDLMFDLQGTLTK